MYTLIPLLHTLLVKYVQGNISILTSIGAVAAGGLANLTVFMFFILIAFISNQVVGYFPIIGSRFVSFYGLATILNPFLILIVDIASEQYNCEVRPGCTDDVTVDSCLCVEGDSFLLYSRFLATEGSGIIGIVVNIIMNIT